ncbi:hypothetical protein AB1Y20_014450 [Prymnesium parvum]|uniref:Uncharacterized protein n=1 Tax=Prymnesium parvum TaxID=97485 RepID=A0AB34IGC9_PRYPA|mmetsp:Transcript_8847/g.21865  ORF Transcript_8847/g.21865 Transcript_8847/m.21865 type:complete len:102 (+) Transcript_8847:305-610(+)
MSAWAKDQGVDKQSFITLMGDPSGVLTKTLSMEMIHPGPYSVGIIGRCKRFALYAEDGVVKLVKVSEAADDPAGDDNPEETLAPSIVKAIKALNPITKAEL